MPIAIILVGPQGSGKSTLVAHAKEKGYIALGMSDILKAKEKDDPVFAAEHPITQTIHSGNLCCEKAVETAFNWKIHQSFNNGENIILDGCTRTAIQMKRVLLTLQNEGYTVIIFNLVCPREICINRIKGRVAYCETHGHPVREDDKDPEKVEGRLDLFEQNFIAIKETAENRGFDFNNIFTQRSPDMVISQAEAFLSTLR